MKTSRISLLLATSLFAAALLAACGGGGGGSTNRTGDGDLNYRIAVQGQVF